MTLKQTKTLCAEHNATVRVRDGELRVRNRTSGETYFTTERDDAVNTARVMEAQRVLLQEPSTMPL